MQKALTPFLMTRRHYLGLAFGLAVFALTSAGLVHAATTDTTDFSQTVNAAGALSIEIVNASYATVPTPSVAMQDVTASFIAQTSSATTFGTDTERIYWENASANTTTYGITMAATGGTGTIFTDNAGLTTTEELDYNDATVNTNDNDRSNDDDSTLEVDVAPGQMTIDASTGTVAARYGATTGVTLGTSTGFNEGTTDSVTLVSKADNSNDFHALYVTGMTVAERMAEGQQPAVYTINMTLTIA